MSLFILTNSKNLKLRIVHLAVGTVSTQYNPESPLLTLIAIDVDGTAIRGYCFNQKRVDRVRNQVIVGDIVFISNAEIEKANLSLTWVQNLLQLKFLDTTQFQEAQQDDNFPQLQWNLQSISTIASENMAENIVIGKFFFILIILSTINLMSV